MAYKLYTENENGILQIGSADTYKQICEQARKVEGVALISKTFKDGFETGYRVFHGSKPFAYLKRYASERLKK